MKTIYVSKSVSVPRFTFNWLWLAIASVLQRINKDYNDYDIRAQMAELTPEEARAEILGDIANHDKRTREAMAWSDIWDGG